MSAPPLVAILDAGAQYAKLIDRRIREMAVETHVLPLTTSPTDLGKYSAIIISGGPQSVYGQDAPKYDPALFTVKRPILGICYGMQLMNYVHKGKIEKQSVREDGVFDIDILGNGNHSSGGSSGSNNEEVKESPSLLFQDMQAKSAVLLTHGDSLSEVAPGFRITARSASGIAAAIECAETNMYGVQFHPEVDLSEEGHKIFRNFLFSVAQINPSFTMKSRLNDAIADIQTTVGKDKKILVLVSGGVDSSVCALLCQKAIGPERVFALHVDTGFMRLHESALVMKALATQLTNLKVCDETETFLNASTKIDGKLYGPLCQQVSPEVKRKIIGDTFMTISEQALKDWNLSLDNSFLAQGTLRPDLIESASKTVSSNAEVIKTHHNDTMLVRQLRDAGKILEPLRDLHKDEVRLLGIELGLQDDMVWRQPFPGPGLAIRVLCAEEPYLTEKDEGITKQLAASYRNNGIYPTLVPARTVGVQGDGRSYSSIVALGYHKDTNSNDRTGVQDGDYDSILASIQNADWELLFKYAKEIPKHIHGINRVVYLFGVPHDELHTKTITKTYLDKESVNLLKKADNIVNLTLKKFHLIRSLSQVPVIVFPPDFGQGQGKRCIAIRTFITNDFMTGVPAIPGKQISFEALAEMVSQIQRLDGVAKVCFDLTSKPPGTTEWE